MGGWPDRRMVILVLMALSAHPAIRLSAQCPDGSPLPCRSVRTSAGPPANSVAVLYFENLSRDTMDLYLADGLTEDITAKLGQVNRLSVTSRAAVRRLRDAATVSTASLGRMLNVWYLVSGSVQRSGPRLRVTVELVRAATGARLWGISSTGAKPISSPSRRTSRGPWRVASRGNSSRPSRRRSRRDPHTVRKPMTIFSAATA